ncbi:hypothetical protein Ae168Ps1_6228 [Pseudonocardia sp. Ae168_Ps1]|uniref:hypothetical protein n=1 Tax=unclassified Pseudonocardia TaxID=2619320 RepID=UPI0009677635|nr:MULTISPECIES: hypothetical protein [unclassified Pseudonocardia]OLL70481.1 hypothetical protein Ae168Ps1_6228 [Pseudonocardia sp. Ae168_Ps1]OLL71601.1 hypothetical protein Ae263Ps1_6089 [Pseudonocardia sp. Ae263_Ps1]
MDGLEFTSAVIGHVFSWPVAVVLSVLILRRSLGGLLGWLSKLSGPGEMKAEFTLSELIEETKLKHEDELESPAAGKGKPEISAISGSEPQDGAAAAEVDETKRLDDSPVLPEINEGVDNRPVPSEESNGRVPERADAAPVSDRAEEVKAREAKLSFLKKFDEMNSAPHLRDRTERIQRLHSESNERSRQLSEMIFESPRLAVMESWRYVETFVAEVADMFDVSSRLRNPISTLKSLANLGLVTLQDLDRVRELQGIRNRVVHGATGKEIEIDTPGALTYVTIARDVVDGLLIRSEYVMPKGLRRSDS